MDEHYGHDFGIARVFCEIQGLRIQGAYAGESPRQTALTGVFIQGAIHRAVNSESTEAGNNERAVTETLVGTENPAHAEGKFHTVSERDPHVPGGFLFHERDSRYVTAGEPQGDFLRGNVHHRDGGDCFPEFLLLGEYLHFDLVLCVGLH